MHPQATFMPPNLSGPMAARIARASIEYGVLPGPQKQATRRCNIAALSSSDGLTINDKQDPPDVLQLRTSVETLNPSHPCSLGSAKQNHQSPNPPHADN